jgi:hypothetical protein
LVARDGVELPTGGFSVLAPKSAKVFNANKKRACGCPIFLLDTGT